ncbi:MAG: hypothetical protein A3K16_00815 [Omnitrophica bacterium RIFCSPLOWO2_01_FULL_45_24]|nr:MAG: hypothetical protein A3K16_00815 [Omnitrophica bacterium RIFCSPLOWO2_01_FULL_45_24]
MTANLEKQKERHLKDYIEVLRRWRDIAITFFVSMVLLVTISSFIMKPVYRATLTMIIDPESPNVLTATGMVALKSEDYLSYKDYFQSQMMIMCSHSLAKKVFEDFKLGETKEYYKTKEPIKNFLKTIRVDPVPDTRLVKLSVDNKDPQLAANIANRMAELYVMQNLYYTSKVELSNLLKNEYLKLETKAAEYAKVYKEGHPEMIKLRTEMADMIKRMDNVNMPIHDYSKMEESLKSDSGRTLAGFKANNISIRDPAEKPVTPIKPKKRLNFLLSIVIGLLGGVGLAFFFEYLDDSVKTVDDIERICEWPILGCVPDIDSRISVEEAASPLGELEKDIFVSIKPKDPIAEAYKSIRTRLSLSSTEEHPLKSVLITSPGPQEGKTITLCNLSIALAQNQKRVLLIDADMRKPRLHKVFKKENVSGLSSLLSGQAVFDNIIQKTDITNLYFISGGILPPDPSELLASGKTKESIAKAGEKFDFVLIDSPPIGILTDATILSSIVDGIIVVVESGKTSKKVLARVCQIINESKTHVIGLLLNKISITPVNNYYSYYYGNSNNPPKSKSIRDRFSSDMIIKRAGKWAKLLANKISSILKKSVSK